ncbi:tissue factor pathway inhibitor-like [Ornithodoros turicata]|uniref:tissue factor pathway inhibitor-like n=1 Tax=Ornithodoros turicata TaxID=34597 RepID=UPI003139A05C
MDILGFLYYYAQAFFVIHVGREDTPPTSFDYPESVQELQNYQDAWAFLNSTSRIVLLYQTFEIEKKYPQNSTCVWVKRVEVNETEKTFFGAISLHNNDSWWVTNLTFKAMTLKGYNVSTFFSAEYTKYPEDGKQYFPVVYQEPGKCAIIRDPYRDTESQYACELWVSATILQKEKNPPKRCTILFDFLCGTTKYNVYDPDCSKKGAKSDETTSSTKPTEASPSDGDICKLPPITGRYSCRMAIPKFTYNSTVRKCINYTYGGCWGTQNLFDTEKQCTKRCPGGFPKKDAGAV